MTTAIELTCDVDAIAADLDYRYGERVGNVCIGRSNHFDAEGTWHKKGEWAEDWFQWPTQRADIIQHVEKYANDGWDVFMPASLFSQPKRAIEYVIPTDLISFEHDAPTKDVLRLLKSIGARINRSGRKGHIHVYHRADRDLSPRDLLARGLRLARRCGIGGEQGLEGGKWHPIDHTRSLGTPNWKPDAGRIVETRYDGEKALSDEDFDAIVPALSASERAGVYDDAKFDPIVAEEVNWGSLRGAVRSAYRAIEDKQDLSTAAWNFWMTAAERGVPMGQVLTMSEEHPDVWDRYGWRPKSLHEQIRKAYATVEARGGKGEQPTHEVDEALVKVLKNMHRWEPEEAAERLVKSALSCDIDLAGLTAIARANDHVEAALGTGAMQQVLDAWKAVTGDEVSAVEPAEDDEPDASYEAEVAKEVRRLEIQKEARRIVETGPIEEQIAKLPKPLTLAEALKNRPGSLQFAIEGLAVQGHNVLIVGEQKTGKSTVAINLIRALVDGVVFLGKFPVRKLKRNLVYLNFELEDDELLEWMGKLNVENMHKVFILNLRGLKVPLNSDAGERWLIEQLREADAEAFIADPAGAMMTAAGMTDENHNSDIRALINRLDVVKREAGVREMYVPIHAKRGLDIGAERVRGASAWEDTFDTMWYLHEKDNVYSFRAKGRSVPKASRAWAHLVLNEENNELSHVAIKKDGTEVSTPAATGAMSDNQLRRVLLNYIRDTKDQVKRSTRQIIDAVGVRAQRVTDLLKEMAAEYDENERPYGGRLRASEGPRNSQIYSITERGRDYLDHAPSGE